MALTSVQYMDICNELVSSATNTSLNLLKHNFRDVINSNRRFCKIENIHSLFKVLEKRGILCVENGSILKHIIDLIAPNNQRIQTILNSNSRNTGVTRVIPPVSDDYIEQIHDLIRLEMGDKWKELARALKISEGIIDNLDSQHRGNIPEMVKEILENHLQRLKNNPHMWRSKLQQALVSARRTDLAERVDSILANSNAS
ncbi:uncharacterized protein LOC115876310 isoform X2 [Sitophilus oryzae]|uniref:Uncharacterized protein LOC115876310 isoform X2 n=1 Tax=Sitophilus oryzae TaxID=7048 RepID=A0A6J2X9I0_SITOR|nr:uncharacterized protein LOC115876310 isoform X2 [Sitophilus oryzae]